MNEELLNEIKSTLPWLLAAGIVVAGYYGVKKYVADRRTAAAESVANAYTTDELEDAVGKFGGSKAGGVLKLRLAKSYFDAGKYDGALELYNELDGKAPDGFADVPPVGKAQCLEALGKFAEAEKAYDEFAKANEKSFLALTAKLGAARCIAQAGDREKAIKALDELKATLGDDEIAKARVESTTDLVKRYEKRAERSLFDAADAAQKQLDAEAKASDKKPEAKPAAASAKPATPATPEVKAAKPAAPAKPEVKAAKPAAPAKPAAAPEKPAAAPAPQPAAPAPKPAK